MTRVSSGDGAARGANGRVGRDRAATSQCLVGAALAVFVQFAAGIPAFGIGRQLLNLTSGKK